MRHLRHSGRIVMTLAALLVAGAMAAPDDARFGGTFTFAVATTPPTLDSHIVTAQSVAIYGGQYIWESLFALDASLAPQPMLVDSWEISDDALTWTFTLREGVLFHNGKELDAEDVVASLRRWREVSPQATKMERVDDIVATGPYTVEFRLNAPLAPLPYILADQTASPVIHPRDIIEGAAPNDLPELVGTGPYRFVEWVPDRHIILERFDDYVSRDEEGWGGVAGKKVAYLDRIVFRNIPESEVRLAGLETGEFHAANPLPGDYYDQLLALPDVEPFIIEFDSRPVIYFSMAGIMADPTMRKAIRAALNMDDIMFSSTGNDAFIDVNPDPLFYRFQQFWSDTGAEVYNQADPELARELAAEAGYDGEPIRFLASSTQFSHRQPAIMITEQLRDAGFNIELDLRDFATVTQVRQDPTVWEITYTRTRIPEPTAIVNIRDRGFDSPEFQAMLDLVFEEPDPERLREAFEQFKRDVLIEQVPWLVMGDMFGLGGVRTDVRDFSGAYNHPLWNVWLDDD
jgi:peptide/nickel transport system substrate-binding protein